MPWTVKARILDAEAPLDEEATHVLLTRWLRASETLSLLVDGHTARRPEFARGTLLTEPVFFPNRFTGGTLVFIVPEDARSLELYCGMAEFKSNAVDMSNVTVPRFMLLQADAAATDIAETPPLATIDDDPLPLKVLGSRRVEQDGNAYALLTIEITNVGTDGGAWEPSKRFTLDEKPPVMGVDPGHRAPADPLWLPAGETRRFELAFPAPQGSIALLHVKPVGIPPQDVQLKWDPAAVDVVADDPETSAPIDPKTDPEQPADPATLKPNVESDPSDEPKADPTEPETVELQPVLLPEDKPLRRRPARCDTRRGLGAQGSSRCRTHRRRGQRRHRPRARVLVAKGAGRSGRRNLPGTATTRACSPSARALPKRTRSGQSATSCCVRICAPAVFRDTGPTSSACF